MHGRPCLLARYLSKDLKPEDKDQISLKHLFKHSFNQFSFSTRRDILKLSLLPQMFSQIYYSEEILHRKGQVYQEYRQNMTIQTQTYEADRENLIESGCMILSRTGELL